MNNPRNAKGSSKRSSENSSIGVEWSIEGKYDSQETKRMV